MDLSRLAVANKSCASHWLPGRSSLGTTVKQGPRVLITATWWRASAFG
ncbi:hypothetical protein PoMZ_04235 [Pyricularia oryzae]|uniref:Uncharacterized protein n=1 Tax=Pyricularia oryzae TaxID=318829 RepID=A0A4P7NDP5_PYROR|nr:hypothetical protein PoMZ_04235 [Pyricularia oryzae]